MKTQITNIINGSKNVRILESAEKYINAKRSTSHNGYAGTSYTVKEDTFKKVLEENGESLRIELFGEELTLKLGQSLSGKSKWYYAPISESQYMKYTGSKDGLKTTQENCPEIKINEYCDVVIANGMNYSYIDSSFVTIK